MSKMFSVDLSSLNSLIEDLGERADEAARPAAQAAAQVIYDEAKRRVNAIGKKTGNLASSIYQAYSKNNSGPGHATYHVSWNAKKAPHGHLVEYGHLQRYVVYLGKDGKWHTAIRNVNGPIKKPSRKASQAEKDAYYVPLKGGPRQVGARPFLRPAMDKFPEAIEAARQVLIERMLEPTP